MSAVASSPAVVRRRLSAAVLVGLPLLAALLGAVLAWALGDDARDSQTRTVAMPAARVVATGDLRFALPDRWTPVRNGPAVPGFDGARTTFVRSWSAHVAIALLPPTSPSLLPPQLAAARRAGAPAPLVLRAGDVRAYHYVLVLGSDRVIDVYAAPTTRGTATVACSRILYMPGDCDLAVPALSVAHGSFLPLSADAAFLEALPGVMARLNAERGHLRGRLAKATSVEAGARAAARLAAAYAAAGRALRPLAAPASEAPATMRVLDRLGTEHSGLADALRAGDPDAFDRSARAIRADEKRLAEALARWRRALRGAGYS
jgi:hypothetical protein